MHTHLFFITSCFIDMGDNDSAMSTVTIMTMTPVFILPGSAAYSTPIRLKERFEIGAAGFDFPLTPRMAIRTLLSILKRSLVRM